MNPEYKLKYPDFAHPGFFRNGPLSIFKTTVLDNQTVILFGQVLVFDESTPPPAPGTELEISTGRWYLTAETPATREAREAANKVRWMEQEARQKVARDEREKVLRQRASTVNTSLNIPARWTSGQKSVLSGLSSHSMGDGRNARSVNHVLLLEALVDGRFKRDKMDFLCTSKSGTNGRGYSVLETFNMDSEGRYVSEVTCKRCLELASRWPDATLRREPELIIAG